MQVQDRVEVLNGLQWILGIDQRVLTWEDTVIHDHSFEGPGLSPYVPWSLVINR